MAKNKDDATGLCLARLTISKMNKGRGMKSTEYESVGEAPEALKNLKQKEQEIFKYVKSQMKVHERRKIWLIHSFQSR